MKEHENFETNHCIIRYSIYDFSCIYWSTLENKALKTFFFPMVSFYKFKMTLYVCQIRQSFNFINHILGFKHHLICQNILCICVYIYKISLSLSFEVNKKFTPFSSLLKIILKGKVKQTLSYVQKFFYES